MYLDEFNYRWLDRSLNGHKRKDKQNLYPIVQGGLHADLREACAKGDFVIIMTDNCCIHLTEKIK